MSLQAAAETVAAQILMQEYVEVVAHNDADGIAAASILCHAMLRAGSRFRLRVRQDIAASDLAVDTAYLLCDLGAGTDDLPRTAMVIDHHLPLFTGEFHVNPRLAAIDGDRELSAAGTAYVVAQEMGDNRDLAGLVIPGIIGDGQEMAGKNLEIFNEGIANGIIVPDRGLRLPGRDMTERWYTAINPYLQGVSGTGQFIEDTLGQAQDTATGENTIRLDILLSRIVLEAAPHTPPASLQAVYGDTFHLQREVIEDAHALTAVIDACGKSGHGELGATLCLRSSRDIDLAWEITRQHRIRVIEAVRSAQPVAGAPGIYELQDSTLSGDVADILVRDCMHAGPVIVYARCGDICRIVARGPEGMTADLGPLVRGLAQASGGTGGGHNRRAGATVPCAMMATFTRGWQEAMTSCG